MKILKVTDQQIDIIRAAFDTVLKQHGNAALKTSYDMNVLLDSAEEEIVSAECAE